MINPIGSLILIKEEEQVEQTTKSGFIVTKTETMGDLKRGTVIALGTGDRDREGIIHPIPLSVGDVVIYNPMNAHEVEDTDGEKYKFINWAHLLGTQS
jgi:co-chaperonin GroES (HSP10)